MYDLLSENTKQAAYFQWEELGFGNALEQWLCVEDIVCFLECSGILGEESLMRVLKSTDEFLGYEDFVRGIAYRLSFYSGAQDAESNWYSTERLLRNSEWRRCVTSAARIYSEKKDDPEFTRHIRSQRVREYYKN